MMGVESGLENKSLELSRTIPRSEPIALDEKMCW